MDKESSMRITILAIFLGSLVFGCASKIKIYDQTGSSTKGVPVPKSKLVKVIKTTNYKAIEGAKYPKMCSETKITESYDYITSEEYYYVDFTPSEFAKGTFEITFNDKGFASKISVNSEANTGMDSVNSLLGTTLPFFKATKAEKLEAERDQNDLARGTQQQMSAADKKAESCVVTSETIDLKPLKVPHESKK